MNAEGILIALSIKGFTKTDGLAVLWAAQRDECERELARLQAVGDVEETKLGWRLTTSGKAAASAALARERAVLHPKEIEIAYERFVELNEPFKSTITAWQMRDVDGSAVPNDHSDEDYDAGVMCDIQDVHHEIVDVLDWLAARVPRTSPYRARLEHALRKALRGERRFVAAPIIDSYHTVWFELHEDLIRLCGKTRTEEAAAGRGA